MARRQPPRENPLRVLTDYLDDSIFSDPKKLSEMVRRHRRMLQTAYHPDSNRNGPFSNEEAEARSKAINASNELDWLTDALALATGDKPESYDGEISTATRVLNTWIEDYKRNRGANGELTQRYEAALRQVSSLTEQLRQSERQKLDLEERLRRAGAAGTTSSGPTRSGFTSTSTGRGTDISDKIREYLNSAESATERFTSGSDEQRYSRMSEKIQQARAEARQQGINFDTSFGHEVARIVSRYVEGLLSSAESATERYTFGSDEQRYSRMNEKINQAKRAAQEQGVNFDRLFGTEVTRIVSRYVEGLLSSAESATERYTSGSDEQRYSRMNEKINQAKRAAQEQGVNFDRLFGREVSEIVGKYVDGILSSTSYSVSQLNESSFTSRVDNAVKAASDFGEIRRFRPEIERVVGEFVSAAISMGERISSSQTRYFDMATRVGAKYGVRVNIPNR